MKKTIELPIEWLERLVEITDKACTEKCEDFDGLGWRSHLYGYVHSLDVYLKEKE